MSPDSTPDTTPDTTPVLTVTLNPTLDVTTAIDRLVAGDKLRCDAPSFELGGGGVNVSRAIRILGGESHAFVALAGATGQRIRDMLAETGIDCIAHEMSGETRFSFTVAERGSQDQYRFTLPGPEQSADQADAVVASLRGCLDSARWDFVVISGSLPPGLPADVPARMAAHLKEAGVRVVLDGSGAQMAAAVRTRPYLIKPNLREARELLEIPADRTVTPEDLAARLLDEDAAEVVVISLGAEGALVATGDERFRIAAPAVEVKSAVGAGDSFVGGLVLGLARGRSLEDASCLGVAAGASAAESPGTALCERGATEAIYRQIRDKVVRLV